MTLDNKCVGMIGLKDIPGGGYSMWRNRDLNPFTTVHIYIMYVNYDKSMTYMSWPS